MHLKPLLTVACVSGVLAAGSVSPAPAAVINGITWLEVDNNNSSVASGSIETDGFSGASGDTTDGNWDYATPHGVIGAGGADETDDDGNGTGLMANNETENPGNLTVEFTGILDPGTVYTVYVAFRGVTNLEGVEVSLDDSNYDQHTRDGADTNLDGTFDTTDTTVLGSYSSVNDIYYVDAGVGTVTGQSDLTVYFREPTTTNVPGGGGFWAWSIIDAIGIDPAPIPEPGTVALLAVGSALLLARRKRG